MEASRHFLGGAATPPWKGGEYSSTDSSVTCHWTFLLELPAPARSGDVPPAGLRQAMPQERTFMQNTWQQLSKEISESVARAGRSIVAVDARAGHTSSGIVWKADSILT